MRIYEENGDFYEIPDEELTNEEQISILKQQLDRTDYKAIKYAEGWYTEEEYAPIKAEREGLRERIRQIENEIEGKEDVNTD